MGTRTNPVGWWSGHREGIVPVHLVSPDMTPPNGVLPLHACVYFFFLNEWRSSNGVVFQCSIARVPANLLTCVC